MAVMDMSAMGMGGSAAPAKSKDCCDPGQKGCASDCVTMGGLVADMARLPILKPPIAASISRMAQDSQRLNGVGRAPLKRPPRRQA